MACLIVTASLSEEVLVRPSIPMFGTIFLNYLLKIYINLLSSEASLLFSTKVILSSSKVLSVNEGLRFSEKVYL